MIKTRVTLASHTGIPKLITKFLRQNFRNEPKTVNACERGLIGVARVNCRNKRTKKGVSERIYALFQKIKICISLFFLATDVDRHRLRSWFFTGV